nr:cytochrome c oxidase subunit II [Tomitella biformata]
MTDINNPVLRAGWPEGITPQATRMQHLWTWSIVAAMVMGLLVWGLVFWTILFHRKRANSPEFPRQTGYNVPLELAYTAFPFVAVAILFFFTVQTQNYVDKNPDDVGVVVDVTAKKWNWTFGYREAAEFNYGGANDPESNEQGQRGANLEVSEEVKEMTIKGQAKAGMDMSYLFEDDIETTGSTTEIPVLVLPVDTSVSFTLASVDVIHSFWVPQFLFKRDVMPYPAANQSRNTFTISEIERTGAFVGRCAEMCGTYHSMMNFEIRAIPKPMFARYLEIRDVSRNGGDIVSNAQALAQLQTEFTEECGEELCSPTSTTTRPFEAKYLQQANSVAGLTTGN